MLVAGASAVPVGFIERTVASGLSQPTSVAPLPDGRVLIAEKTGAIRVVKSGQLLPTPLVTIPVSTQSERGVLGLAVDPGFPTPNHLYVYYTTGPGSLNYSGIPANRVSRFSIAGDLAQLNTESIILDDIASDAGNHNGGCLRFGPDGRLYISTGDGGSVPGKSQQLSNLNGKILRINKDGTIPADNPFVGQVGAREEIYAYGFRNPWRFNFRPGTSQIVVGDVGSGAFEELNVITQPGQNFGWPTAEGPSNDPNFVSPFFSYAHGGNAASITGGVFVGGPNWPASYANSYLYSDYIRGSINRLDVTAQYGVTNRGAFSTQTSVVDFTAGPSGLVYTANIGLGTVSLIAYAPTTNALGVPATAVGRQVINTNFTLSAPAPAGGLTVTLTSSNPALVGVTPSVTVPSGASAGNYVITVSDVAAAADVTITLQASGSARGSLLRVTPHRLSRLVLTPVQVVGGNTAQGRVTLTSAAPTGGTVVNLRSLNTSIATVPATVTVPAGATSATFTITTRGVTALTRTGIRVSLATGAITAPFAVQRASLVRFQVSPDTVIGGQNATGTVQLNGHAGLGGATVNLRTNSQAGYTTMPSTVTIPQGQSSATFTIRSNPVRFTVRPEFRAAYLENTRTARLTVLVPVVTGVTVSPTSVRGGATATVRVTISGAAPAGGIAATLTSSLPGVAPVPFAVRVSAGQTSATVTIPTRTVTARQSVTLTATLGGSRSATLTVNP